MDLIDRTRPVSDQRFPDSMQRRHGLLRLGPRTDKAHARSRSRFTDGLGIGKIRLIALPEGLDKVGGNQLRWVTQAGDLTGDPVGAGTSFHHYGARREVAK